jgi:hypothetical protein
MMKLHISLTGVLTGLLVLQTCFADDSTAVRLNKYYAASCQDYNGTWHGFITDPSDLFSNGGPWPLTISLYNRNNHIIGQSTMIQYSNNGGEISKRQIWAECRNGALNNIFWGNKGACGSYSHQGLLVSKNVLVLQLNYESSMTGTQFLVFLTRKNNVYPYPVPKKDEDFMPGSVTSCH